MLPSTSMSHCRPMTNDETTAPFEAPLVVNGWSFYAHPLFLGQLDRLIKEVEVRKARASEGLAEEKLHEKARCDIQADHGQ